MELNGKRPVSSTQLQIQQLTVEIKAIKVGSKQMTQALFKQLPVMSIIDPDTGEITGTPWCVVNYFWQGCGKDWANHLHLVWQQGDKIYRDCLCTSDWRYAKGYMQNAADCSRVKDWMYSVALALAAYRMFWLLIPKDRRPEG